mgnify:CR=1 FL=1
MDKEKYEHLYTNKNESVYRDIETGEIIIINTLNK